MGTVVSRDCRKYRVWQCLDFLQLIQRPMWAKNSPVLKSKHCQTWDFLQAVVVSEEGGRSEEEGWDSLMRFTLFGAGIKSFRAKVACKRGLYWRDVQL